MPSPASVPSSPPVRSMRRLVLLLSLAALALAACSNSDDDLIAREVVSTIPWDPPQSWTYNLLDDDDEIGTGVLSVEGDGDDLVFTQEFAIPDEDITDDVTVHASAADLSPVSAERTLDGGEGIRHCTADYSSPDVSVHDESDEGERDDVLEYPSPSYDSWLDIFLWATIDFSVGYETPYVDVLVCKLARPDLLGTRLKVVEQEEITVPAGTFDTWHLEIKSGGDTQDAWYTADDARTLVRYDNSQLIFELESMD